MRALSISILAVLLSVTVRADDAAELFRETCAGCHTVGGGDLAGPDLVASTGWPRADLRAAVKRMEDNTGPMSDEQVEELVDLLLDPDVAGLLAGESEAAPAEAAAAVPPGSPDTGRRLFYGEQPFANGGSPCFACHAALGRGGSLAVDLTAVHSRMGEPGVVSVTQRPGFPMMKAAYATRPVLDQEARDLAAFFRQAAASGTLPAPESLAPVLVAAIALALVVLGSTGLLIRSRRERPRLRLASNAPKRHQPGGGN